MLLGPGGTDSNFISNSGPLYHKARRAAGVCTTTLTNYSGGTVDFSGNPTTGTITTFNAYPGSTDKVRSANPAHIVYASKVLQGVGPAFTHEFYLERR